MRVSLWCAVVFVRHVAEHAIEGHQKVLDLQKVLHAKLPHAGEELQCCMFRAGTATY